MTHLLESLSAFVSFGSPKSKPSNATNLIPFAQGNQTFILGPVLTDLAEGQLLLNHFNHPNELSVLITSECFSITKYSFDIVTNTIGPKLRKTPILYLFFL